MYFTDEASFRRDGTIHNGWYKKGVVAQIPESNGRFESIKLFGAVDPLEGRFHLVKAPKRINTIEYSKFLIHLSKMHSNEFLLIFQDNAPWHSVNKLKGLLEASGIGNIEIFNLPKYSPDMNPCEKLWYWLRDDVTHGSYYEKLCDVLCNIWKFYRRAYNKKEQAKIKFKTETRIIEYL